VSQAELRRSCNDTLGPVLDLQPDSSDLLKSLAVHVQPTVNVAESAPHPATKTTNTIRYG